MCFFNNSLDPIIVTGSEELLLRKHIVINIWVSPKMFEKYFQSFDLNILHIQAVLREDVETN